MLVIDWDKDFFTFVMCVDISVAILITDTSSFISLLATFLWNLWASSLHLIQVAGVLLRVQDRVVILFPRARHLAFLLDEADLDNRILLSLLSLLIEGVIEHLSTVFCYFTHFASRQSQMLRRFFNHQHHALWLRHIEQMRRIVVFIWLV